MRFYKKTLFVIGLSISTFIIGLVIGNTLFFQHYFPISPYFSDFTVDIIRISVDEKYIQSAITNNWNDESAIDLIIETRPSYSLDYLSNCTSIPCTKLDDNIISIKGHEMEAVKTNFNITYNYTREMKICIKAISRLNKNQYGMDCLNVTFPESQ